MKLGFSTLSLFRNNNEEIIKIAKEHNFDMIELLGEGPFYLNSIDALKGFDVLIHGPTVDLNIASINRGIRAETIRQLKETVDVAEDIGARAITIHPGKIGRKDERLRKAAVGLCIEGVSELMDYATNVKISVENMPSRFSFLGNRIDELERIQSETGCVLTIDTGHANTCEDCADFFDLDNIYYFHLNDKDGVKDQHVPLGEGTLDLDLLKKVDEGILELNTFEKVLKSKDVIDNI
mgnify:FL=1